MDILGFGERRSETRHGREPSVEWWKRELGKTVRKDQSVEDNVAAICQMQLKMEKVAMRDPNSGLLDQEGFRQVLEEQVRLKSSHPGLTIGVAIMDLDDFSRIAKAATNEPRLDRDRRVDRVVGGYGRMLRRIIEEEGVKPGGEIWRRIEVGRLGGEEYGLAVSEVNEDQWREILDHIRQKTEMEFVSHLGVGEFTKKQTTSIGGVLSRETEGVADILKTADRALYLAKNNGKNRVELVSSPAELDQKGLRGWWEGKKIADKLQDERRQQLSDWWTNKFDEVGFEQAVDLAAVEMDKLEQNVMTDALTGVLHQGAGRRLLRGIMEHARDLKEKMGVALVDIVNFKGINDREGHERGDQVLVEVAGALKGIVKSDEHVGGIVIRWRPGGQFVIVLPHLAKGDKVEDLAKLVKEKIGQVKVHVAGVITDGSASVREVSMMLDTAMEQVKQRGGENSRI